MKKSIFFSLMFSVLLIAGAMFTSPIRHVFAAPVQIEIVIEKESPPGIVSCGLVGNSTFCDMCDLIVLVKGVLDFIWKSAWVIAAGMMIYGGFYMILPSFGAGGSGMFEKGKKILTNVAWGLVIVFFAWVAIDTIIKVVAGRESLTSGTPATLPQSSNTTTFDSQATPDLGDVPGQVTVPRFSISFGPWNKISCTRAPERAPLALLSIPPEFQCVDGKPVQPIPGFNPCDPLVAQNIQNWVNGTPTNFSGVSVAGRCTGQPFAAMVRDHGNTIAAAASANNVPVRCAHALFATESSGNVQVNNSSAGAAGLGQIMPNTAKDLDPQRFGNKSPQEIQAELRANPQLNIQLSMRYFGTILNGSRARGDCLLAAAGYNAGPQNLEPPRQGSCNQQFSWQCIPETRDRMVPGMQQNLNDIDNNRCAR